MRLICPNCGAQYEVADDVIPTAGRDVQCSNCGHTWFETPGGSEAAEAGADLPTPEAATSPPVTAAEPPSEPAGFVWQDDEEDDAMPDEAIPIEVVADGFNEDEVESEPATADQVEAAPAETDQADTAPDAGGDADKDEDEDDTDISAAIAAATGAIGATVASPQRRELAPEVTEILREEAAREEARRSANIRATLETQSELGIEAGEPQQTDETRRRTARMRGEAGPIDDTAGSRRDLLPDIEEINSTLRATTQRAEMADAPPDDMVERRRGFRFGFGTIVVIALIAAGIYIAAPRIIDAVPATAGVLGAYVDGVDQGRLWLDLKMQQILVQMNPPDDAATN